MRDSDLSRSPVERIVASREKIMKQTGGLAPTLGIAIHNGILMSLGTLETIAGTVPDGCGSEVVDIIATGCRNQWARVEQALAAAAAAAGVSGHAAPATDTAIDAFLIHVGRPWQAFPAAMAKAVTAIQGGAGGPEGLATRMILMDLILQLKIAMLNLKVLRIVRTPMAVSAKTVDLTRIFEEAQKVDRYHSHRQVRLHGDPVKVIGSSAHIHYCVNELIRNALRFSPYGSPVTLATFAEGRHLGIYVDDQGAGFGKLGIDQAILPFRRSDRSLDVGTECRLGLGLANIASLAKKFAWSLEFIATGHGERPVLILPAAIS